MKRTIGLVLVMMILIGLMPIPMRVGAAEAEEITAVETIPEIISESISETIAEEANLDLPVESVSGSMDAQTVDAGRATASGTCGENLTWTFDEGTGKLTISGTGEMTDWTSIGETPWYDYGQDFMIESVVLGNGVTSIGNYAFYDCYGFNTVTLPRSLNRIGQFAFTNTDVNTLTLPSSLKIIDAHALDGVCITSISLPASLEVIGDESFAFTALQSITLPKSLKSIGANPFLNCNELSEIRVDSANTAFTVDASGVLYTADFSRLITCPIPNSGSYTVDPRTKTIGALAFANCVDIPTIHLPDGLFRIDDSAFIGTKMTQITLPQSLTYLGERAFYACEELRNITIPDNVTSIGPYAFDDCINLTSAVLPQSLTGIESGIFSRCSKLTEITIPPNVRSIDAYPFVSCSRLSNIIFTGNAPSTINGSAFYQVKATCSYPAADLTWTSDVRKNYGGTITWVPYGEPHTHEFGDDYKCACGIYGGKCGDNLDWILDAEGNLAISGTGQLTDNPWSTYKDAIKTVTIENGVANISYNAFKYCYNLQSVSIPESVTGIGDYAFSECRNLTSITLPGSVTTIGTGSFEYCLNLSSVTIPEGVTSIGEAAFQGCEELRSIILPQSLTFIGSGAFEGCYALSSITIPANVTTFGNMVFAECTGLETITFEGNACDFDEAFFNNVQATAYYPAGNKTWTSAVRQNYGGTINWVPVGDVVTYTVSIPAMEAAYDAEVQLWVYAVIPDEMLADDNAYVEMVKDSAFDGAVTTKVTAAQLRAQGKTSYGDYQLTQGMASGEMTKEVTYRFYDGNGNPATILDAAGNEIGTEVSYSILDYVARVLDHGNPEQKEMVKYLVTYGGYAQTYFSKKFSSADLDAENPAYNILDKYGVAVPSLDGVTDSVIANGTTYTGENAGIQYNGAEGYLDSAIYLRVYFLLNGDTPIDSYDFQLAYADASGKTKTMSLEPAPFGREYYVDIPDIPAAYLDYDYVISITNNENGETCTVTTSILSWIRSGLVNFNNEHQKNMLKAMYLYNQAANKFFGK